MLIVGQSFENAQNEALDAVECAINTLPRKVFTVGSTQYRYGGKGVRIVLDQRYREQFGIDSVVGYYTVVETVKEIA